MTTIKEIREVLATVKELDNPLFWNSKKIPVLGFKRKSTSVKKPFRLKWMKTFRLESMFSYEKELYKQGLTLIAGVDEVGRSPLAGPVVAAAVIYLKIVRLKASTISKKIPKVKTS